MIVIFDKDKNRVPIKAWVDNIKDIEEGALLQLTNLSNLPFVFKHVVANSDVHQGYGMPIGGVIATENVVIPNAVGVDIGCGMCALKTTLLVEDFNKIEKTTKRKIWEVIKKVVPTGFGHNREQCDKSAMPNYEAYWPSHLDGTGSLFDETVIYKQFEKARYQLGTLGGGNHFIEIQAGDDGFVWIMIHSGSRNLGKQVADYYNDIAIEMNKKYYSSVPAKYELAFLPLKSMQGQMYMREMQYCVDFALANRQKMMYKVMDAVKNVLLKYENLTIGYPFPLINIAHNYASLENHFGKNVVVHRKGATLARKGTIGIIPGSQSTNSYIVEGLGNKQSFTSCSHGAGRAMSRKKAREELDLQTEIKKLDDAGVIHGLRGKDDLDEAGGAYKNIDIVMENQKDLVKIITELSPLIVIKGDTVQRRKKRE